MIHHSTEQKWKWPFNQNHIPAILLYVNYIDNGKPLNENHGNILLVKDEEPYVCNDELCLSEILWPKRYSPFADWDPVQRVHKKY